MQLGRSKATAHHNSSDELSAVSEPHLEFIGVHDVEDPLARYLGFHGDRTSVGVELEVPRGVGVGGEEELTTGIDGEAGEIPIEVLAAWEAVDLHRNTQFGTRGEDHLPAGAQARTIVEVASARVSEDMDSG